jgi:hypothetical protein
MRLSLRFCWFNLFEGVTVSAGYLVLPLWAVPTVLFRVTVSEGCGLVFCCG